MQTHVITVPAPNMRVGRGETIPRWSSVSRLALGGITFAMPIAALSIAITSLAQGASPSTNLIAASFALICAHFILTAMYVAFAGQNPRLDRTRNAWMLALVFAGPVSILVYWIVHVWSAPHVGRPGIDELVPDTDGIDVRRIEPVEA